MSNKTNMSSLLKDPPSKGHCTFNLLTSQDAIPPGICEMVKPVDIESQKRVLNLSRNKIQD